MSKLKVTTLIIALTITLVLLLSARHTLTASVQDTCVTSIEPVSPTDLVVEETAPAEVDLEKLSEAFGHLIGSNLDAPGFTFDIDAIIRGMRGAIAGSSSPMSEEEYDQAVTLVQEKAFDTLSSGNLSRAEDYLTQNAHDREVVELEGGRLQYRIEKAGHGAPVEEGSVPLVHYTGRFADGTIFGSSTEGEPIALPLGQTIPGFSIGILGMKEGEKRQLFVHPDLGYGTSGHLPPNSLLVFEIEVIQADVSNQQAEIAQADVSK